MKKYSPSILDKSIWQQIELIFWKNSAMEIIQCQTQEQAQSISDKKLIERFYGGHSFDGLIPNLIETNKEGVKIEGEYWILPSSEKFKIRIIFQRPNFTSVQSITKNKMLKSIISEYSINTITKETSIKIK